MRVRSVLTVIAILLAAAGAASAEIVPGQATPIGRPTLNVTGTSKVEVVPDTVRVTAIVITEGKTVEDARERNAQLMQKATAAVKALDLPKVTTKTLDYQLNRVTRNGEVFVDLDLEKWEFPWRITDVQSKRLSIHYPFLIGFSAANQLQVKIQGETGEKLAQLAAKAIDALMDAGANAIGDVAYSADRNYSEAVREALTKAVEDARMTADSVAAAAGRKIVGVRTITPSYSMPRPDQWRWRMYGDYFRALSSEMAERTPTSLSAGTIDLTASVTIHYELDYNPGDTAFVQAPPN